jgi:hypothetical protein
MLLNVQCSVYPVGVEAWFDSTVRQDVNAGIRTRAELKSKDPVLACLMQEVFGDDEWRYQHDCPKPLAMPTWESYRHGKSGEGPSGQAAAGGQPSAQSDEAGGQEHLDVEGADADQQQLEMPAAAHDDQSAASRGMMRAPGAGDEGDDWQGGSLAASLGACTVSVCNVCLASRCV